MYLSIDKMTDLNPVIVESGKNIWLSLDIAGDGHRDISLFCAKELDRQQIVRLFTRFAERLDAELIRFLEEKEVQDGKSTMA